MYIRSLRCIPASLGLGWHTYNCFNAGICVYVCLSVCMSVRVCVCVGVSVGVCVHTPEATVNRERFAKILRGFFPVNRERVPQNFSVNIYFIQASYDSVV